MSDKNEQSPEQKNDETKQPEKTPPATTLEDKVQEDVNKGKKLLID